MYESLDWSAQIALFRGQDFQKQQSFVNPEKLLRSVVSVNKSKKMIILSGTNETSNPMFDLNYPQSTYGYRTVCGTENGKGIERQVELDEARWHARLAMICGTRTGALTWAPDRWPTDDERACM